MKNLVSLSNEEMRTTEGGFLFELLLGVVIGWVVGVLATDNKVS